MYLLIPVLYHEYCMSSPPPRAAPRTASTGGRERDARDNRLINTDINVIIIKEIGAWIGENMRI